VPVLLNIFSAALTSSALVASLAPETAPPPSGTVAGSAVTTGTTEISGQGQFATASAPAEDVDATELNIAAGGMLSTGNARSLSITGLGRFRLRREIHQFRAEVAGNYGRAAIAPAAAPVDNVTNVQGLLRYDVFVHPRVGLFLQTVGRHDPFQGLQFRLNVDPGVAAYVLKGSRHRLWFEAGYDFQFDVRTVDATYPVDPVTLLPDRSMDPILERTFINHATRLMAGYANTLNERVTFDTGVEYLQSVIDPNVFRINWAAALTAQLMERVTFSTSIILRYENEPIVERRLDTVTAVLLGVRLL